MTTKFSFTVSHNVRWPVARLLGLTNIIQLTNDADEILKVAEYVNKSATELDTTLRDVPKIIDIRNELYAVREKILIADEWEKAMAVVGNPGSAHIKVDFEPTPYIFGIRPMVQSILYNLISNSIKYRQPNRELLIEASSYMPSQPRQFWKSGITDWA